MNCAEKLLEPTIFFTPSHHIIQVSNVLGVREIKSNFEFRYQIIVSSIKSGKAL